VRSVRKVTEYRGARIAGILCCHCWRASPLSTYAERGSSITARVCRPAPRPRWNRMRHAEERDADDDAELRRIAMPADRRTGGIFRHQHLSQRGRIVDR